MNKQREENEIRKYMRKLKVKEELTLYAVDKDILMDGHLIKKDTKILIKNIKGDE